MNSNEEFNKVLLLTENEYQVFKLYGKGMTAREIATLEGHKRSLKTILSILQNIRFKLEISDWKKLMFFAVRYDMSGMKRKAIVPELPKYTFHD